MIGVNEIQQMILDAVARVEKQKDSLQKEFKLMKSWTSDPDTLAAKERQIDRCRISMEELNVIFDCITDWAHAVFKLEACSLFHGVSMDELIFFTNRSLRAVEMDVQQALKEGFAQVPESLRPLIDEGKSDTAFREKSDRFIKNLENDLKGLKGDELHDKDMPKQIRFAKEPTIPFETLRQISQRV